MISRKQLRLIAKATRQCWENGEGPAVLVWSDGNFQISSEGEAMGRYVRRWSDNTRPLAVLATPMPVAMVEQQIDYAEEETICGIDQTSPVDEI